MALGLANNQHYPKTSHQQQQQPGKMLSSRTTYQHNQRPIAPAPYAKVRPTSLYAAGTTLDSNNPAVVRRNARERNRVKQVNNGFTNLRQHIPVAIIADLSNGRRGIGPGANKKLSKVDTLRMAVEYIRRLQRVIDDVDSSDVDVSSVSSFNSSSSDISNCSSPPPPAPPPSQPSQLQSQTQPPTSQAAQMLANNSSHFKAQYYFPGNASYAFTFDKQQQQQQQQHHQPQQPMFNHHHHHHHHMQQAQLVSPAASISSSTYSTDSYYQQASPINNSVSLAGAAAVRASKQTSNNDVQVKFEQCYDEYPNASTDDEEDILDYISLWQDEL